jgi:hydrogenase/urease accessory protein HupE
MCYTVPAAGAIVTSFIWGRNKNVKIWWLNLMFWGGALFGLIDHIWNKELFLISENIANDLLLGVVITLATLLVWAVVILVSRFNPTLTNYVNVRN